MEQKDPRDMPKLPKSMVEVREKVLELKVGEEVTIPGTEEDLRTFPACLFAPGK